MTDKKMEVDFYNDVINHMSDFAMINHENTINGVINALGDILIKQYLSHFEISNKIHKEVFKLIDEKQWKALSEDQKRQTMIECITRIMTDHFRSGNKINDPAFEHIIGVLSTIMISCSELKKEINAFHKKWEN